MIWTDGVLVSRGEGSVYGERMLGGYRVWNPYRSKLSALYYLQKGFELEQGHRVLYLGAAHGTTVSHVADYVEVVYAVESAPGPMQHLLDVVLHRKNIVPVMADAALPEQYAPVVEAVDLIYQDIAQPDQVNIALKNGIFLKPGGTLILMLKTRSVDVRKEPAEVLLDAVPRIASGGYVVIDSTWLAPYHRDHAALICKRG